MNEARDSRSSYDFESISLRFRALLEDTQNITGVDLLGLDHDEQREKSYVCLWQMKPADCVRSPSTHLPEGRRRVADRPATLSVVCRV